MTWRACFTCACVGLPAARSTSCGCGGAGAVSCGLLAAFGLLVLFPEKPEASDNGKDISLVVVADSFEACGSERVIEFPLSEVADMDRDLKVVPLVPEERELP